MKTTLDLPDQLLAELKARAARAGRDFEEFAARLLIDALRSTAEVPDDDDASTPEPPPVVRTDEKTGLPVIQCNRTPTRAEQLTPRRVADILTQQEADWARDAS
jgi:plasmid stability protein